MGSMSPRPDSRRLPSADDVIEDRTVLLAGGRRYSGWAAQRLVRKMRGRTGAVCSIRNPQLLARGVKIKFEEWNVTRVEFAGLPSRAVGRGTVAPFGIELTAGSYLIQLTDDGGRMSKSASFDVVDGHVTLVTVYPPTDFLVPGRHVRSVATIEVEILPSLQDA